MKPYQIDHDQGRLFETRLSIDLNPSHPLMNMKDLIDWKIIEKQIDPKFHEGKRSTS